MTGSSSRWSIHWFSRFCAAAVAFIWVLLWLPQYAFAANTSRPVLLVVGDSVSAAYGLRQEEGWVELLRQRIARENLDYNVVNASISGETTAGGASRMAGLLEQYKPAIVVIELGGNDGLRGTPLPTMREQLNQMVKRSRERKARVVLVGMEIPPNYGAGYARDFSASFVQVAQANHVPLVPSLFAGFGEHRELFQADGIHPIASAEPMLLDNVWRALHPLLTARRTTALRSGIPRVLS
jgi:acyl-CoA thioesterase I